MLDYILGFLIIYLSGSGVMYGIYLFNPPSPKDLLEMKKQWEMNFDVPQTVRQCKRRVVILACIGSWASVIFFVYSIIKSRIKR